MYKYKNKVLIIIVFIFCALIMTKNFKDKDIIKSNIRIGVSDDTSGFVINYMKNKNRIKSVDIKSIIDPYPISDC